MRRWVIVLAVAGLMVGATTAAVAAGSGGRPLSATLTPEEEVAPFVGVEGASGEVHLALNPGQARVCVELTTEGFDLVLAHIHQGVVGANGPVVVDFTSLIDGDGASGCVAADRATILEIIRNPAGFYVNLHQGIPPDPAFFEAIRGQLGR